jgi:hypothetical protein
MIALGLLPPRARSLGVRRAHRALDQAEQVHPRLAPGQAGQDDPLSLVKVGLGEDVGLFNDHPGLAGVEPPVAEGLADPGQPRLQRPGAMYQLPRSDD